MPVYKCKIRGDSKVRLVRAKTASQACKHLVEAETMTADELAEELGKEGAKLETYSGPADAEDEQPDPAKDSEK